MIVINNAMDALDLFEFILACFGFFLAFLWFVKNILNAGQSHTLEDMERFWGVKFRDTSVAHSGEVGKFHDSFIHRLKIKLLPKRSRRSSASNRPGTGTHPTH